ncbi:MAG: bifunctional phosphopantothenoylcysteine decarboxylase/phosphopantothenate--cysteine ligase CoaBC [Saprospiraceae bacterium]
MSLKNRKIILGISGSIAAYKCAFLTRLLIKAGAEVKVLMTPAATKFITPLTLSTLSNHAVLTEVSSEAGWNNHVELGLWADAMVLAPTTATTLGKLANAICDNMLVAVYLSARCPVFFAPAMDLDMWVHPATQLNVQRLQSYGNYLIPVGHGELASGLVGNGRMAEPEDIVATLSQFFQSKQDFSGKNVLVTAGPTYEAIDPVRFIGNHSSGKMGVAIAEAFAARGAKVHLVLGPSQLNVKNENITVERIRSAQQMYEAVAQKYERSDVTVLAAAVADYRPAQMATQKIKKKTGDFKIELERTIDIAATIGKQKRTDQINIGFALETNDAVKNAQGKLERKNFDAIVLNTMEDKGATFQHDTNKVTIIRSNGTHQSFPLKSKKAVAEDILNVVLDILK